MQSRRELLVHLGEVDARRLYLEEGCSSMFVWCQRVLHFAEGVAYKRIQAARAARQFPAILEAVRCGDLHLTAVGLLAPKLTKDNVVDLIGAARHRSADEIRKLLADREPKPAAPTIVRRLPDPPRVVRPLVFPPSIPQPARPPLRAPIAKPVTEPLGTGRYTAEKPSRHIPAAIRRAVWERDAGRCTYVSAGGRRCDSKEFLQPAPCAARFRRAAHGPVRTANWI
jgi:hypothetical protein